MPRPVVCPHCREELEIPAALRRREVRCAACRNTFVPAVDGGDAADPSPDRSPLRDDFDDEPRRPRRRRGGSRVAWVVVLGMFACCGLGCGGFCIWAVFLTFPNFEPFDSPEGRFHAEFPGQPNESNDADGTATRRNFEYKRDLPKERFFVRYVDLDAKVEGDENAEKAALKDATDRAVRAVPGSKELSRTVTAAGGYDATDVLIQHPDRTHTVLRIILAKQRLYSVGVTGPNNLQFDTPYVSRFLDGFQIAPEPQPQAPARK